MPPRYHAALARLAVTSVAGGQYHFADDLDLDVIDVAPTSSEDLVRQLTAAGPLSDLELNLLAHTWAYDTAATDAGRDRTYRDVCRFDEPQLDLDDVADAVDALAAG